ncbi:hypothetical protein [Salinigranum sp. GCM10025319]|uniref:hypothetical protein n=1 Tax=Salinigranum sp. GCM10025319 TaxID=3252687 RepID=UPI003607CF1A
MLEYINRQNISAAIRNPNLIARGVRRLGHDLSRPIADARLEHMVGDRISVMDQDWDNLIILDACRYDTFVDVNNIDGDLSGVLSQGADSRTFMQKNFVGRELHDTIYVTANLHADFLDDDTFYTVKAIPYSERNPEKVTRAAVEMYEKYPDKRLIVHYMQPHKPYLGPSGDQAREKLREMGLNHLITRGNYVEWDAYREGYLSEQELRTAYRENLQIALEHGKEVIKEIPGKTVFTADHGELLGEKLLPITSQLYGHPYYVSKLELLKVPWLVVEADNRRDIQKDEPIGFERIDSEIAKKRLKELGYA